MAGSSFFALFDDIAVILDDVAVLTKVAARKTAGVLGDDLALNAQQVSGVSANRELPVVWAVAKGSFVNKLILVPSALLISALAPWAVTPLLMVGGAYLCFEGVEKLAHKWLAHAPNAASDAAQDGQTLRAQALQDASVDMVAFEQGKIKGAVRTDFVLSAEIVAITLGTVAEADFARQLAVLSSISMLMTVGVYGLVAVIVKLDDLGLYLSQKQSAIARSLGHGVLRMAPYLMKGLSVVGTAAMFMVGGAILTHGIAPVHAAIEHWSLAASSVANVGGLVQALAATLMNAVFGVLAGGVVLGLLSLGQRCWPRKAV